MVWDKNPPQAIGLMGECLARKQDQNGTFSYYLFLILSYFKSDDSEAW